MHLAPLEKKTNKKKSAVNSILNLDYLQFDVRCQTTCLCCNEI